MVREETLHIRLFRQLLVLTTIFLVIGVWRFSLPLVDNPVEWISVIVKIGLSAFPLYYTLRTKLILRGDSLVLRTPFTSATLRVADIIAINQYSQSRSVTALELIGKKFRVGIPNVFQSDDLKRLVDLVKKNNRAADIRFVSS